MYLFRTTVSDYVTIPESPIWLIELTHEIFCEIVLIIPAAFLQTTETTSQFFLIERQSSIKSFSTAALQVLNKSWIAFLGDDFPTLSPSRWCIDLGF